MLYSLYMTKSSVLSFVNGTNKFRNAFGYGIGEIKMNLQLVK